jgi:hypothetical protein
MVSAAAICIDFTGKIRSSEYFQNYCQEVKNTVRNCEKPKDDGARTIVVVDRGFGFDSSIDLPHLVSDHLNLTGNNPLVGPNDPCGDRFPVINDIYISECGLNLPKGVAVGLRDGIKPSQEEDKKIRELGGSFYCYNLVPTMLVAAHAGWKVIGIVVPDGFDANPVVRQVIGQH